MLSCYVTMEEQNQSSDLPGAVSGTKDVSGKRLRGGTLAIKPAVSTGRQTVHSSRLAGALCRDALCTVISEMRQVTSTANQVHSAIRDGLNTIRLHDREVRDRLSRKQQQIEDPLSSEPEFVDTDQTDDQEDVTD